MPYTLTVTQEHGYLHFRVCGVNSVENVRDYLREVYSTCLQRQCSAVLIEENLSGPSLQIAEVFAIASAGSSATAPAVRSIAYVDMNPEHSKSRMQFAENVAVTRGINIRMFSALTAAEEWMRYHVAGEVERR